MVPSVEGGRIATESALALFGAFKSASDRTESPSVSCHNLRGGFGLSEGDELPPQYWSSSIASTCVFADDALPSGQPAAYASDMAEQSERELS